MKLRRIHIPEWGGSVFLRLLSGMELTEYLDSLEENPDKTGVRLLSLILCDDTGKLIVKPGSQLDLGRKDKKVIARLADAAAEFHGLTKEAVQAARKYLQSSRVKFQFRLAMSMGMTRRELLNRIDAEELLHWDLLESMDPYGQRRGDYQTAYLVQTIVNVNRGQKTAATKLDDCLLKFRSAEEEQKKQTAEEMERLIRQSVARHNARWKRMHGNKTEEEVEAEEQTRGTRRKARPEPEPKRKQRSARSRKDPDR